MHFEEWMERVVQAFEVAGVGILAIGSLAALIRAALALSRGERDGTYERARQDVGRAVLLGLEVLIIADIVQTITIDATIESAVTLALIVLVRTFLSFSLEIELEGVVPWHRRSAGQDDRGGRLATDSSTIGAAGASAHDGQSGPLSSHRQSHSATRMVRPQWRIIRSA